MQDDIETTVGELGTVAGVTVTMAIGIEHFREGLITLTVAAEGRVRVLQRRSGQDTVFEAEWPAEKVLAFGRAMKGNGFTHIAPVLSLRSPGDVPVWLELARDGRVLWSADVWHGDRYKNADLHEIIARFDETVREISNGALPF
jgi:hypothetical protein